MDLCIGALHVIDLAVQSCGNDRHTRARWTCAGTLPRGNDRCIPFRQWTVLLAYLWNDPGGRFLRPDRDDGNRKISVESQFHVARVGHNDRGNTHSHDAEFPVSQMIVQEVRMIRITTVLTIIALCCVAIVGQAQEQFRKEKDLLGELQIPASAYY